MTALTPQTNSRFLKTRAITSQVPEEIARPRVVLYARKSTETEDRQVQSIDDQIRLCQQEADRKGYVIVQTIAESRSAKNPAKRPGFQEMLRLLESSEANAILAWHPDRIARNAVDGGWILDLLDRGLVKSLIFASSYTFENSPEGKLMLGMIFSQAKYYVDKLSHDVQRGMDSKREKGHYPHRAPEGYLNNIIDKTIEVDTERFSLLRQAIDLILSGTVPAQAHRILNEKWGYRTRKTRRMGGIPLAKSAFYEMLSNPFYYGVCREKGILYPGIHPPMMSEEEFEQIQRILGRSEKPRYRKHRFLLSGFIRCGRCNCMISASRVKGHIYYHCSNAKGVCDRKGIREEILEELLCVELAMITIPESIISVCLEVVDRFSQEQFGKEQEITKTKLRTLEATQQQMRTLLGLRARDLITDEEYIAEKQRMQEEMKSLQSGVANSQVEIERIIATVESALHFAAHASATFAGGDIDARRRVVERLGGRYILTGQNLLVEPTPLLTILREGRDALLTFKPKEIGSGRAKETLSDEKVSFGWGKETLFKMWQCCAAQRAV